MKVKSSATDLSNQEPAATARFCSETLNPPPISEPVNTITSKPALEERGNQVELRDARPQTQRLESRGLFRDTAPYRPRHRYCDSGEDSSGYYRETRLGASPNLGDGQFKSWKYDVACPNTNCGCAARTSVSRDHNASNSNAIART